MLHNDVLDFTKCMLIIFKGIYLKKGIRQKESLAVGLNAFSRVSVCPKDKGQCCPLN